MQKNVYVLTTSKVVVLSFREAHQKMSVCLHSGSVLLFAMEDPQAAGPQQTNLKPKRDNETDALDSNVQIALTSTSAAAATNSGQNTASVFLETCTGFACTLLHPGAHQIAASIRHEIFGELSPQSVRLYLA
jgi:hypothetical protein